MENSAYRNKPIVINKEYIIYKILKNLLIQCKKYYIKSTNSDLEEI